MVQSACSNNNIFQNIFFSLIRLVLSGTIASNTLVLVISIKVEQNEKLCQGKFCCLERGDVPQVYSVLQEQSQPVEIFFITHTRLNSQNTPMQISSL